MKKPVFSICIPTYNGAYWISDTLKSILSHNFQDYEIVISDDNSNDDTLKVINSFKDNRIKLSCNKTNLGYGKNLQKLKSIATGDIIFLMGQDDILFAGALLKTYNAFSLGDNIGAVTRPYYWFDKHVNIPVRAVTPYDESRDSIVSISGSKKQVEKLFESLGQLSGLAYRKEYMEIGFHDEIFTSHIYPFAHIAKRHDIVFLKDYTVAVRIRSSQTRYKSDIYTISPTESWVKMFKSVYCEDDFIFARKQGIDIISRNFAGLIQLKNYASMKILIREILILIKYRWQNILNIKFWFFSLITVFIPRIILQRLTDFYKEKIHARKFKELIITIR